MVRIKLTMERLPDSFVTVSGRIFSLEEPEWLICENNTNYGETKTTQQLACEPLRQPEK